MNFTAPVLLVGNGPVEAAAVALARPHCTAVVAADGGAKAALAHGLRPEAVIGDMDSCPPDYRGQTVRIPDQNSTDFEKCLGTINAPLIIGIGFLGGRLDHELAALNALVKTSQNVVLIGETDLVFRLPATTRFALPPGTRISLFPMGPVAGVTSQGLAWPLDGLHLAPAAQISTSNHTTAPEISLNNPAQPLLCILPRAQLPATLKLFIS
jgi:thiamine pyrophosphokinase